MIVNKSNLTQSPLLKFRSVTKINSETNQKFTVSLVLRENGRFEVYSDYTLVSEYYNPMLQCVDIKTDLHQFYLKFIKVDSQKLDQSLDDLEIQIRKVRHFWRNKISFSTSKLVKNPQKWSTIIHRKIAPYFRLYSQIQSFSMFMLVSHRNMISIYEMTKIKLIH